MLETATLSTTERMERVRERLLRLHLDTGLDHLGSAQSCFEIFYSLYFETMTSADDFVLSKGHAVSLWYACLAEKGLLSEEEFARAMRPGGLPAHPPSRRQDIGISFGTGALGHGMNVAGGIALAKKLRAEDGRVFALLSDGECDEGSTWEAALFAAHHELENLTVIIDRNGWQCMGATEKVLRLEPLAEKWASFGFQVVRVADGHALPEVRSALATRAPGKPVCIIAATVKANGLPQFRDRVESHYFRLTKAEYDFLKEGSR